MSANWYFSYALNGSVRHWQPRKIPLSARTQEGAMEEARQKFKTLKQSLAGHTAKIVKFPTLIQEIPLE